MRIEKQARRYRVPRLPGWLRETLNEAPALPTQLLAVVVLLILVASEGGYGSTNWPPAALLLLGLLVVTALTIRLPRRPSNLQLAGLGFFAAYAAWSFLSILWADVEADAWEAANRTASYLVVLALFLLWPAGPRGVRLLVATFSLGVAAIGLVEILRADSAAAPDSFFIDVRFSEPAGYINANVAMWTVGLFGCLVTAATPRAHPALRGCALGATTLLAGLALLGQSRGWVFALPVALLVLLLISPDRLRLAFGGMLVVVALLPIRTTLLDVHDRYSPSRLDALLSDATVALILVSLVVGLLAALWAYLERRPQPAEPVRRRLALATGGVLVTLGLLGGAVGLAVVDDPAGRVSNAWTEFKEGQGNDPGSRDESRFASAGSNRYDFWTVAWDMFRDNPIRGAGAENFQRNYLKSGESTEKPRYPHSLELEVLSGLGAVGAVLLGGAFLALLAAAVLALRGPSAARGAAAGALGLFIYWLLHASVDWFWAFFALTGPAIAALAMAAALSPAPALSGDAAPRRRAVLTALGISAAVLLALAVAAPWLSAREVDRAADIWREDPAGALNALDRAEWLNPLSTRPAATAGTIELRLRRTRDAADSFRDVLRDDPDDAYAALELGLIAAAQGRKEDAIALLRRSLAQDPRDPLIMAVLADVEAGKRVSPSAVNERIARDALTVAD